ncbi:MAG TPA: hypothetical protein VH855_17505 [Acetobacteraceae bacterium]|jgi:hypothetical protein
MLETTAGGLMVLERERPDEAWRTAALTDEEILRMPEISIEIPVRVLYADITFPQEGGATA